MLFFFFFFTEEEKMAHYAQEEKHIREENLRLQRRLPHFGHRLRLLDSVPGTKHLNPK